jgi:hypothetical protein
VGVSEIENNLEGCNVYTSGCKWNWEQFRRLQCMKCFLFLPTECMQINVCLNVHSLISHFEGCNVWTVCKSHFQILAFKDFNWILT